MQRQSMLLFQMFAKLLTTPFKSFSNIQVPTLDLTNYINKASGWRDDCKLAADLIHKYGLVYAMDPRIDHSKNSKFLDQMEKYFELRPISVDVSDSAIPLGLKFKYHELLQPYQEQKRQLKPPHQALTPIGTTPDPTWRYHHALFSERNMKPQQFPNFGVVMEEWGQQLLQAAFTLSQMTAIGLNLQQHAFRKTIEKGTLYLSPPAVNLSETQPGDVITAFHRDFSLFTAHGRARYSGLYAWLLTGEKFKVQMPENHVLIQSGRQLQWLTGGYLKAGWHEVIHNDTVESQKQLSIKDKKSLWRIASTLFCHVQGNLRLKPLDRFRSVEVDKLYPDILADEHIIQELALYIVPDKQ